MPETACDTKLGGEDARLLPQKAVYFPGSRTLVVADVHIGKGASFRSRSYFAPDGITSHDLNCLSMLLERHRAERLIVLGDLVHSQDGLTKAEIELFDNFRLLHETICMVLIVGNHDRRAHLPDSWKLDLVKGHMHEGSFIYCHEYEEHRRSRLSEKKKEAGNYVLSGHIHPSVILYGAGKQKERLPCFWLRRKYAVLPSFGVFTGSYAIRPSQTDKVFVVAKDTVIPVIR
jgi:DNA ligase-associated metallophosphoesterase